MALLVFFPRSAGTWIVASHLRARADGLRCFRLRGTGLKLRFFCCCCWRRSISFAWSSGLAGWHQEQESHGFCVDSVHHVFEERERFLFEFHDRIFLRVAAESDAFLQMIESEQVILPLRVHDIQRMRRSSERVSALRKALLSLRNAQSLFRAGSRPPGTWFRFRTSTPAVFRSTPNWLSTSFCELRHVPLVGVLLARAINFDQRIGNRFGVFGDECLLVASFEKRAPQRVDRLPAACSSRRRTQVGVCGLRSFELPPLSVRFRFSC